MEFEIDKMPKLVDEIRKKSSCLKLTDKKLYRPDRQKINKPDRQKINKPDRQKVIQT